MARTARQSGADERRGGRRGKRGTGAEFRTRFEHEELLSRTYYEVALQDEDFVRDLLALRKLSLSSGTDQSLDFDGDSLASEQERRDRLAEAREAEAGALGWVSLGAGVPDETAKRTRAFAERWCLPRPWGTWEVYCSLRDNALAVDTNRSESGAGERVPIEVTYTARLALAKVGHEYEATVGGYHPALLSRRETRRWASDEAERFRRQLVARLEAAEQQFGGWREIPSTDRSPKARRAMASVVFAFAKYRDWETAANAHPDRYVEDVKSAAKSARAWARRAGIVLPRKRRAS